MKLQTLFTKKATEGGANQRKRSVGCSTGSLAEPQLAQFQVSLLTLQLIKPKHLYTA